MQVLDALFRWIHIVASILWIGHLYFFNFVNVPFQATMDGETKKKVNPELLPRALFWFRWGAAWTWASGILLLALVFYHGWAGGNLFDAGTDVSTPAALAMIAVNLLGFLVYDVLVKQEFAKNLQTLFVVGLVLVTAVVLGDVYIGGFGYRGTVIHTGAMFGTIMAFNVWFRIWPSQQKIIAAVQGGTPPDASLVALAGTRSKHNTYLSVPLVWTMINAHTTSFALLLGIPGWAWVVVMTGVGWWFVSMFYRQSVKDNTKAF
ncbi:MAG: urate hydroxylase PuuD [Deltaproteobacteria bacterium]|nr:urate hydroxylase PuuD [Deltaproteobacteria bacterium]